MKENNILFLPDQDLVEQLIGKGTIAQNQDCIIEYLILIDIAFLKPFLGSPLVHIRGEFCFC